MMMQVEATEAESAVGCGGTGATDTKKMKGSPSSAGLKWSCLHALSLCKFISLL